MQYRILAASHPVTSGDNVQPGSSGGLRSVINSLRNLVIPTMVMQMSRQVCLLWRH